MFDQPKKRYTQALLNSKINFKLASISSKKILLEIKNLSVNYPGKGRLFMKKAGEFNALKEVSFKLREGETIGVVGESGCGKTSLALSILNLIKFSGSIILEGENLKFSNKVQLKKLRRNVQIVFQDPFSSLSPRLSVKEIILEGIATHFNFTKTQLDAEVENIIGKVGLNPDILSRYPHEFSGGQRQRTTPTRAVQLKTVMRIIKTTKSILMKAENIIIT